MSTNKLHKNHKLPAKRPLPARSEIIEEIQIFHREVNLVVELSATGSVESEPLQLHNQHRRQTPQSECLG